MGQLGRWRPPLLLAEAGDMRPKPERTIILIAAELLSFDSDQKGDFRDLPLFNVLIVEQAMGSAE